MDHDDLLLFLRVLDAGSISLAGRRLGVSAAVASQRLKRLESRLGVRLFHRTTRRLEPTAEGTWLAEQGRASIEELARVTEALGRTGREISGTLRVSVPESFGRQHISPLLPAFLEQHPRLGLNVQFSDQVEDLVASGLDIAIRIGSLEDSSAVAQRLATDRRVLCASPSYLRRRGAPRTLEELENHECLLLRGGSGLRFPWRFVTAGGVAQPRVRGRFETNLGEALRDAALAGLGIALHSTWHVCDDLHAGRLQQVLPDVPPVDGGIYAVAPERRKPARVRAFIEHLKAQFRAHPPGEPGVRLRETAR